MSEAHAIPTAYEDLFRESDALRAAGSCRDMATADLACVWTCTTCRETRGPTIVGSLPETRRKLELVERKCALYVGADHYGRAVGRAPR